MQNDLFVTIPDMHMILYDQHNQTKMQHTK